MNFFSHLSEIVRRSNHPHFKNFHIEKKVPLTRGGKRGLKGLLLIRVCGKASHSFLSAEGGGRGTQQRKKGGRGGKFFTRLDKGGLENQRRGGERYKFRTAGTSQEEGRKLPHLVQHTKKLVNAEKKIPIYAVQHVR